MNRINKEPVKYLTDNVSTGKLRPSKEVFNYYVYCWGWVEALRVFKLTEKQAIKILFPDSPKASDFKHLKQTTKYTLQGNRDNVYTDFNELEVDTKVVHDTTEYRNITEY